MEYHTPIHRYLLGNRQVAIEKMNAGKVRIAACVALVMYPRDSFGIDVSDVRKVARRGGRKLELKKNGDNPKIWLHLFGKEDIAYYNVSGLPKFKNWTIRAAHTAKTMLDLEKNGVGPLVELRAMFPNPQEEEYGQVCECLEEAMKEYAVAILQKKEGRNLSGKDMDSILQTIGRIEVSVG